MRQDFLNACIYAKQKVNLTWPNSKPENSYPENFHSKKL